MSGRKHDIQKCKNNMSVRQRGRRIKQVLGFGLCDAFEDKQ